MRVLACDPGYGRLGLAILEKKDHGTETIVFSECFETNPKDDFFSRLHALGKRVAFLIEEYHVDVFALEQLFFAKNTKTALAVSESRGVILYQALDAQLPVYEFTPNQIKVAVTGYGSATKQEVFSMVHRLIDLDASSKKDDEIDAIAVGLTFFATNHRLV